ncbi:MAG: helix-turn-helix domain-containing protein [Clostridia bacterium]
MSDTLNHCLVKDKQIAGLLNLHVVTVRRLALSGTIPSLKIGKARRYDPDAVLASFQGGSR